ncbi:MAG: hypothetical protein WCB64_02440, partial [Desulfobaccales bacterium]
MGPWNNLPDWAQELEEHLEEGEAALFILHGQVYDYTRVNGDYLPFRHFLGQWLDRERHVVFYNLGAGLEFGDAAGEESFREALEPQEKQEDGEATEDVSLIRALGQEPVPAPKPLPQSPREVLLLCERVMAAPSHPPLGKPLALVLEYAET